MFEATHGTAPHLAGTNRANPVGADAVRRRCCSATSVRRRAGDRLEAAVAEVLAEGTAVTYDLRSPGDDRPAAGTFAMTEAVIARL